MEPLGFPPKKSPTGTNTSARSFHFYLAFGSVIPAEKRTLIGLDVSGSMAEGIYGNYIAGIPGLFPRDAAAAMALVTVSTEPNVHTLAFSDSLMALPLTKGQRVDQVIAMTSGLPFGRTDCALPMLAATQHGLEVDSFVIYTDNETWAGEVHPAQALKHYREKSGIDARLAVVGMTSDGFSIADPNDPGMLDVVGFDTAAPNMLAAFARGEV